jgi:general secretion pathway protein D
MKILLRTVSLVALLGLTGTSLLPLSALAGTSTQDKISLMADAIRARAEGDLGVAREKLEALAALAPDDPNVRRLLTAVNEEYARQRADEPTPVARQVESSELDRLMAEEMARAAVSSPPASAVATPPSVARAGPRASAPLAAPPASAKESSTAAFEQDQAALDELLRRGRAQFIAGDYEGARESFAEVETRDPHHAEAKSFQAEIARTLRLSGFPDRTKTREEMLQEVVQSWQRPQVFDREQTTFGAQTDNTLEARLQAIVLPRVSFSGVPLSRVVDTLAALSEEYDPEGLGVNMVFVDPGGGDPPVNITLRGLTLARILDFTTEAVGYEYDVQTDAVVVRLGHGGGSRLETEFFPITRSTIIRLTGVGATRPGTGPAASDPFAPIPLTSPSRAGAANDEETALRNFLQRAGVPFDPIEGANLALADGQLIVTQSARNMEKVRNILRRYTEVKQVEIEARFLEVRQGDLEELGFDWAVLAGGSPGFDPATGLPLLDPDGSQRRVNRDRYQNPNRTLAGAFGVRQSEGSIGISRPNTTDADGNTVPGLDLALPVLSPGIPHALDLGTGAGNFANIAGVIGGAQVDLVIRALERKTGNDLMSAPKVTVLSGKTAEIVVAQELRYPQSYGDIEAQVGRGDSSGSGSAGVAITAGTPQDFTVRNVGVTMSVTPAVEDDNSISLLLEPEVTEFEGFVEYGGTSVAIASNTTVTVPSGFFQPIFSVRRVRTEVTIWDGATVVMGGLTREQVVSVEDRVPILGHLPLLGRLFQSKGESSEKRNLLIFVTANLVSPGGSPQRQTFRSVEPGTLFQNPTIVTPGGAVNRGAREIEE